MEIFFCFFCVEIFENLKKQAFINIYKNKKVNKIIDRKIKKMYNKIAI